MQLKGENLCKVKPELLYHALLDPNKLALALPGCKSLKVPEPNVYTGEVELGVGPVKGTYSVTVNLVEQQPPAYLKLEADGKGLTGQVSFTMELRLQETEEGTLANWTVDAMVSGLVASVGSRVLSKVARFIADQFFSKLLAAGNQEGDNSAIQMLSNNR